MPQVNILPIQKRLYSRRLDSVKQSVFRPTYLLLHAYDVFVVQIVEQRDDFCCGVLESRFRHANFRASVPPIFCHVDIWYEIFRNSFRRKGHFRIDFLCFLKKLHANGCRLKVPIGATTVDIQSDLWKSGEPLNHTVRDESGKTPGIEDPLAHLKTSEMCIGTLYWQNKMREFVLPLVSHEVDMIHLDGFPSVPSSFACYDESHGHTPGMGRWITDNWHRALAAIIQKAKEVNPKVAFTSEGISEDLIPYIDVAKYWRDGCSEVGMPEPGFENATTEIIPLFNYLYHEYIICMEEQVCGPNTLCLTLSNLREYNRFCIGRMFTWGAIPLIWAEYQVGTPGTDKQAFDLVKRIATSRTTYAEDFLVYGRMQRPLDFSVPLTSVPVFGSLNDSEPKFRMQVPSVLHSVWKADDSSAGVVFVNITSDPVPLRLPFDFPRLGLKAGSEPFLYCVRDGAYSSLKTESNTSTVVEINIQPYEIVLLGLCEKDGQRAKQVSQLIPGS